MTTTHHDPTLIARIGLGLLGHLGRTAPAIEPETAADKPAGRVVLVTSARRGEGKSFVSRALARALAEQQEGEVVWVDAAFDAPAQEDDASRRGAAGFSEVMMLGSPQGLVPAADGPERLWRLGRGVLAQGALLYRPEAVRKGLAALRAGFALTILDAPCLGACGALAGAADACVMVVDARRTPRHAAQAALADARLAPGRLAGIVLNHRPRPVPHWLGGD